ncbi:hypothetical protein LUZ60_007567 [Juncus effusus]|nr:hypothetical protein LUZ60_007567 [Juncus effusus]
MYQHSSLISYDSAPGSLLTGLADSVSGDPAIFRADESNVSVEPLEKLFNGNSHFENSGKNSNKVSMSASKETHLTRHDSSPAGFFSNLLLDHGPSRNGEPGLNLKPQLSLPGKINPSRIPEKTRYENAGPSNYMNNNGFTISSWDENMDSINFSTSPSKRNKGINSDIITSFSDIDSQFSLPANEKFFNLQQDQVPFKVRAKRGCATHPRSIAERERRMRISEKLRKLQELVPNMEKQTSTSDMLDLAVRQIKELQSQLSVLNQERQNCTCKRKSES